MKLLTAAAIFGMILGAVLIIYTAIHHKKLPSWSVAIFSITGAMIIIACILIAVGASSL